MKKTFSILLYTEPSHGWAKVKRQVLENLGIADKISSYSYQYNDNVYLEEDRDFPLLLHRLYDDGVSVSIKTKHTDNRSRIRSYDPYEHQVKV